MYLLAMHPGLLLKIAYVLRRTSNKKDAYQRIINKNRISNISDFINKRGSFFPNAIIIAFDDDGETQKSISYVKGNLTFPVRYCSAWVIDGQHRLYGFLHTKYKRWQSDPRINEECKLPVVAFKSLSRIYQIETFININYNQKRIDATLLCDLASVTQDLNQCVGVAEPSSLCLKQAGAFEGSRSNLRIR